MLTTYQTQLDILYIREFQSQGALRLVANCFAHTTAELHHSYTVYVATQQVVTHDSYHCKSTYTAHVYTMVKASKLLVATVFNLHNPVIGDQPDPSLYRVLLTL